MPQLPEKIQELTVGQLAARSGAAVSALHFYESKGLISSRRTSGNQRRFSRDALRRVAFVRAAQRVGIPLATIREALAELPQGRTPTEETGPGSPGPGAPNSTSGSNSSTGCATPHRLRTPRGFHGFLKAASVCALIAGVLSPLSPAMAAGDTTVEATVAPAAANDHCGGQCSDILPPGQNGNATLAQILLNQAFGTQPAHAEDQLGPYANLATGYQGLTNDKINTFFNDASFGVPDGQAASTVRPAGRDDVTIVRDKKTGVPHITGTTRYGTEFGAGYAAAQDRLWLMDLFRHVGRGQLTPFAGGAPANQGLEQQFWRSAPYTEDDLEAQIESAAAKAGERGELALADVDAYVAGVNAYIDASDKGRYFPGEYVLTGHKDAITNAGTIEHFKRSDLIALASVIGSLFGAGGGGEVNNALSLLAAQEKYGVAEGTEVWESFRQRNDPEAVLTQQDGSFPYLPTPDDPQGRALPDAGSVEAEPLVYDRTGSAGAAGATGASAEAADAAVTSARRGMSNALVVSGEHSASGHPVAVFGPQTGYFAPQLLMLQEIQGPGISAWRLLRGPEHVRRTRPRPGLRLERDHLGREDRLAEPADLPAGRGVHLPQVTGRYDGHL
ncbi:hypothetical protein STENM36S_06082 [Streptomyces tendae]